MPPTVRLTTTGRIGSPRLASEALESPLEIEPLHLAIVVVIASGLRKSWRSSSRVLLGQGHGHRPTGHRAKKHRVKAGSASTTPPVAMARLYLLRRCIPFVQFFGHHSLFITWSVGICLVSVSLTVCIIPLARSDLILEARVE